MARKKDTPQKAALREMMGNYLHNTACILPQEEPLHWQTENAKIKAVENRRYILFSIGCRDLCDICNALF